MGERKVRMSNDGEGDVASFGLDVQGSIMTVVMVYFLFAALWILLSDRVVIWLFQNPEHILLASTVKGWLFVVVTALLLYGMLRRLPLAGSEKTVTRGRFKLILSFVVGGILLVVGASTVYTLQNHHEMTFSRLRIIVDLKARQIGDWLSERLDDIVFVQKNAEFAELQKAWCADQEPKARERIVASLDLLRRSHGYQSVVLLDAGGHSLNDSGEWESFSEPLWNEFVTMHDADRIRVDLRLDRFGQPSLFIVAPLGDVSPRAWIGFQVDPTVWLYPMLQFWPMPDTSGETLLFRARNGTVQFLNALRYHADAALKLQLPLERGNLLAVQLLNGDVAHGQIMKGRDYRDVPVYGVAHAIPKTDWHLVAKIDQAELYRQMTATSAWILLAGVLAVSAAVMAMILLRRGEQLAVVAELHRAQEERLRALQLLDAIVDSSEDAIFAKDLDGRYILFNKAAGGFVGMAAHRVLGLDDGTLFPAEQAEMIRSADRRVIAEKRSIIQEERLATHQGIRFFSAFKGPLLDLHGQIIGSFGISRDITERKQAEESLRQSEVLFRTLFQTAAVSIILFDKETGTILDANRRALASYGFETLADLQENAFWIEPPYSREDALKWIRSTSFEGKQRFEWKNRDCHGAEFWEEVLLNAILIDGMERILAVSIDITARKNIEEELLRLTVETIQRNEELERFNEAMVGRELVMLELKQEINALSRELGREPPYSLASSEQAVTFGEER